MEKKQKIKYKVFQFRLNDETYKKLKQIKKKKGLTWNLTFFNLIKDK